MTLFSSSPLGSKHGRLTPTSSTETPLPPTAPPTQTSAEGRCDPQRVTVRLQPT